MPKSREEKSVECDKCDTGFNYDNCPINSDRDGYTVSKEAMHKHGLCFTMTEEEHEQVMMAGLMKSARG